MTKRTIVYEELPTERVDRALGPLDTLDELTLVDLIHDQDRQALAAVGRARECIAALVVAAASALDRGGRLIYVGAGTSGRLAAADAAECPPTFGTRPGQVVAVIAGGRRALSRSVEGAEDSRRQAREAVRKLSVGARDLVCGVSASGVTPFVKAALSEGAGRGARTALVTCGSAVVVEGVAELVVCLEVGAEAVAGSTRMKAGLATKAVLHTLTTAAMIRQGRVYDNLMVDVVPSNHKLRRRARRIVTLLTGLAAGQAGRLLKAAGDRPKVAAVMHHLAVDARQAEKLLRQNRGRLRQLIGDLP